MPKPVSCVQLGCNVDSSVLSHISLQHSGNLKNFREITIEEEGGGERERKRECEKDS